VESVPVKQVGEVLTKRNRRGNCECFQKACNRTWVKLLLGQRKSKWKKGKAIPTETTRTTARRL
jgi:hypothetical protein